jgi:uncharacterized membrane protein
MEKKGDNSHRLERWVHWSLLTGILVSGFLLALGLVVSLARGGPRPPGPPPNLAEVFRLAIRGRGVDLLDLGLLALIGTPIVRVFVLAVGWGLAGERRFLAVALVVLGLLGLSFALGTG